MKTLINKLKTTNIILIILLPLLVVGVIDFFDFDNDIYLFICNIFSLNTGGCFLGFYDLPIWETIGTIGLIITVTTALIPISKKAALGIALFEDAIQVIIGVDGVFNIYNIFDEPIIINSISQYLLEGEKDFGLDANAKSIEIKKALTKIQKKEFSTLLADQKRVAPKMTFSFANTLTHLPRGYERESLWIVVTKIEYQSTGGKQKKVEFIHRFSIKLEPRNRWIEVV